MKNLLIYCLLISCNLLSQTQTPEKILDSIYHNIINQNGCYMEFEYFFENDSYKMEKPIIGSIVLYSNNRFYLTFDAPEKNIIQIYNGDFLQTFFLKEKEIHIDNITENTGLFIQEVFGNYKEDYKIETSNTNTINVFQLIPKKKYHIEIFNNCIDTLQLPSCLKLPKQCKIGITSMNQKLLNNCLKDNNGYIENNILHINIEIDPLTKQLMSITQERQYNSKEKILIKKIGFTEENMLIIDTLKYKDFEMIDLR